MAIRIYIDQGHNPSVPNGGAVGNGLKEQDITYEVGIRLKELLDDDPDFDARVSRPTPETTLGTTNAQSLGLRVQGANEWNADFFVSIHANASVNAAASGSEAYAYSTASPGFAMGQSILDRLNRETGLRDRGTFVRPTLYVLRRTKMPAVLIELGFITNPYDAELMAKEPDRFARGIYEGILQFYGLA